MLSGVRLKHPVALSGTFKKTDGSRVASACLVTGLVLALSACTTAPPPSEPAYRPPVYRVPVEPVEPEPVPEVAPLEDELITEDPDELLDVSEPEEVVERPEPREPEPFDDSPLYSAEVQLLEDASRYADAGNLQLASASVERVLRINPRSAPALVQLAKLRLAQSAPKEAEQLLLKAISGSAYDRRSQDQHFQRQLWELVVEAREALRDVPGMRAAQARVDALR